MIFLKSESEIDKMRVAAQLVSRTLGSCRNTLSPVLPQVHLTELLKILS